MEQKQRERNISALEWFDAIIVSLTLVSIILFFLVRTARVEGSSMVPTLTSGDQVVARSFIYRPSRGDIVLIDGYIDLGKPIVKRVIGISGDEIDINFETGDVYVNGEVIEENYISAPTTRFFDVQFPVVVPEGHLFLLGDNRPVSKDSRSSEIGMIDERDVLGKVIFRLFPLDGFGGVYN